MPENEIMAELRAAREAYAKRFNYDLEAIFRDLQEKQKHRSDREIVPANPRRISALAASQKKSQRQEEQTVRKQRGVKEPSRVPPGQDRIATPIPAPGGLGAVQAFLNTMDVGARTDELRTPADLGALLSRQGLLPAGVELSQADLERAHRVRRGLRALLAVHGGARLDAAAVADLDRAAVGARAQVRFDPDGASRLEPANRDFDEALGTLLGFVHEARSAGKWSSFKLCNNSECRRSFFDFTKSRTGKWCTRRCGEKIRARAFRRTPKYRRFRH